MHAHQALSIIPWHSRDDLREVKSIGWKHQDTVLFDDTDLVAPHLCSNWRIRGIVVYGNQFCNGWQVLYEIDGRDVDAPKHCGNHHNPRATTILLEPAELIRQITVVISTWAHCVNLKTTERTIQIGNASPRTPAFSLSVPQGCSLVSLTGGVGGHIHNVGFTFCALPWRPRWHSLFSVGFKQAVIVWDAKKAFSIISVFLGGPANAATGDKFMVNATTRDCLFNI